EAHETRSQVEIREDDSDTQPYGFGSGVIIDSEGYILTSNHVVEAANKIEVKLSDERKFIAKMIGSDRDTDLALIKVESEHPLPAASLGDSNKLKPGQWVMAIGNPFVYDHTVTVGVISALNRNLNTNIFDSFIQTDAAINFGNSGGPLLNIRGEVIGINTLISSQGTGIGFAIPINMAKEILPQLKEKGRVTRGFLGVDPQQITPELQSSLGLGSSQGVIVSSVRKDTPAEKAGLKRYDVILELNGNKIESVEKFRRIIADTAPGNTLRLKVLRDKTILDLETSVAERNERTSSDVPLPRVLPDKIGLKVADLTADLREEFDVPESVSGIVVLQVRSGLQAEEAGLQRGDVIVEVNKKPAESAYQFELDIKSAPQGHVFLLYVYRDDTYQVLTLSVP
ncbi:MAG TPA: Do family serine endopeptidase, partial [Acidobacteriota bacterium]|nr:Do family serine endopeptidase [Acidobacteriota bacterium]